MVGGIAGEAVFSSQPVVVNSFHRVDVDLLGPEVESESTESSENSENPENSEINDDDSEDNDTDQHGSHESRWVANSYFDLSTGSNNNYLFNFSYFLLQSQFCFRSLTWNSIHSVIPLVFVATFPHLLHMIPLAALAVILVFVGIRLAHPAQVFHLAEIGRGHAIAFLVTLFVTLYEDLLMGVFCGLLVEFGYAFIFGRSIKSLFRIDFQKEHGQEGVGIRVRGPVVFSNWVKLSEEIYKVKKEKKVTLDLSDALLVDHSTIEQIERLRSQGYTVDHLEVIFHPSHERISRHPLSGLIKKQER